MKLLFKNIGKIFFFIIWKPVKTRFLMFFFGSYSKQYYHSDLIRLHKKFYKNDLKSKPLFFLKTFNFDDQQKSQSERFIFFLKKQELEKLWNLNDIYQDKELINASHRFFWLLKDLSEDTNNFNVNISNDIEQVKVWINKFGNTEHIDAWHPYNVSERISNMIVFVHYLNFYNKKKYNSEIELIINSIRNDLIYLLDNLEYPASGLLNNHIINNSRAIYIGGSFFQCDKLVNIAKLIFKLNIEKILSSDGVLDEASTHYHFLITKNIIEIQLVAEEKNDIEFSNYLKHIIDRMLQSCYFFLNKCNISFKNLPKIGDLSPDVPFQWFNPFKDKYGWTSIWRFDLRNYEYKNLISKSELNGWLRINRDGWTIFTYLHKHLTNYPVGHGHNDFTSFCLYYNSLPILVDIGRFNYKNKFDSLDDSQLAISHSSVLIDGEPIIKSGYGSGLDYVKSGFSRQKCKHFYDSEKIIWGGITASGIEWQRTIRIIDATTFNIIDETKNNNTALISQNYILSDQIRDVSDKKGQFKFSMYDINLNISFSESFNTYKSKVYTIPSYGVRKISSQTNKLKIEGYKKIITVLKVL